MDKNLSDIPSFFVNRLPGQTFYRPISREIFNLVMYKSFGLNPLPFHLFNLLLILANVFLVKKVFEKISKQQNFPIIAAGIYGLSAIHNIEIYYLASVQTLMATYFLLLSFNFYLIYRSGNKLKFYLSSLGLFFIALMSHESAVVMPGLVLMLEFFVKTEKVNLSFLKKVIPFGLLAVVYLVSISAGSSLPKQIVYQPIFNIKSILNTLMWFSLWSFNFPEALVDFVGPKLSLNLSFVNWYKNYAISVLALSSFILTSLIFLCLFFRNQLIKNKLTYFFISSFLVAISPFLLFPQHKFIYYLSFPSIWLFGFMSGILILGLKANLRIKFLTLLIIVAFGIFSYQTANFNQITYWAAKRAVAAKSLLLDVKIRYPVIEKGAHFYFIDDPNYPIIAESWGTSSKQASFILSGSDALKLLYNDSTIKVFYQANDPLPEEVDINKLKIIVARFPY